MACAYPFKNFGDGCEGQKHLFFRRPLNEVVM